MQTIETFEDADTRQSPDALMNLVLRFETAIGPRTVIACSVPRQVAAEIAEVMHNNGQYAAFVDRHVPLSIEDRLLLRDIDQIPRRKTDEVLVKNWEKAVASRTPQRKVA